MIKKREFQFDSAGWGVFLVLTLVLIGPCAYYAWNIVLEDTHFIYRIGLGLIFAMFISAVLTWILNMVLQGIHRRRINADKGHKKAG